MWLRRIWTRIRDTVVKKFSEWVDKECPLIEDEDDSVGEKTIKEVVDKSLLEESIISSLEKAKKERVVKVKKRQGAAHDRVVTDGERVERSDEYSDS